MYTVGFLSYNMSIQPKGVCKFGLITANPVKDQTIHKVDKCGFN